MGALSFVKRKEIPLVIMGQKVTGYQVDIEELELIGERYPWFGDQIAGRPVDTDAVSRSDMLRVASAIIAASVEPDTEGDERAGIEADARKIPAAERADLMSTILAKSFPEMAKALESAEGNAKPAKPNRAQRRAATSKSGGDKPQT